MLFLSLLSWWYTAGWAQLLQRLLMRIAGMLDFFSIGLLLKSLFSPYRQLSVGKVQGSLSVQLHAWADRQISRGIGAMVRLAVISFGLLVTVLGIILSVTLLVIWPIVPVLPFVALLLAAGGGT